MTTRMILDTNVIVAAGFAPRSASAELVDAVRRGAVTLVWNEVTRAETRRLLDQIPPLRWSRFADLYEGQGFEGPTDPERYVGLLGGRLDREFAALAHATGAMLISSDDDFLSVRDDLDVKVLTPSQARAELDLSR